MNIQLTENQINIHYIKQKKNVPRHFNLMQAHSGALCDMNDLNMYFNYWRRLSDPDTETGVE